MDSLSSFSLGLVVSSSSGPAVSAFPNPKVTGSSVQTWLMVGKEPNSGSPSFWFVRNPYVLSIVLYHVKSKTHELSGGIGHKHP